MNTPPLRVAAVATRPSPVVALQYRDFRLLWLGQLISGAGTQMQAVTINYHIYALTGSAIALGLTGLVRFVPVIVFSLVGGVFADAHDRRRLMFVTQSLMMVFAAALGLATQTGWVSAPFIYLMAALTSSTVAFDAPARQALAPNLVAKEHLTNAMSLNNMMMQGAAIIGPAIAGFVIAGLGVAAVYWINAVSFLAVLIALLFMRTPTQEKTGVAEVTLASLAEGVKFVRKSRIILSTMLIDFFATFFSTAFVLLPIFAQDVLHVGPEGLGILYSAEAVGSVAAGIVMALIGTVRRKGRVFLIAVTMYGVATALYGASQWFALSFLFLALVGASDTVSTILRNTIRQLATPDHLRGRMTAVNMIFFMGGPQLGNVEAGVVAALFGAPFAVVSGGIATVIAIAMMMWFVPQLRNYQD